ncbi:MAG: efflux RND transporter periplasmic adaptor subunit [Myxococcales bacterium]
MTMTSRVLVTLFACTLSLACDHADGGAAPPRTGAPSAAIGTATIDKGAVEQLLDTYGKVEFAADRQRSVPFVQPGLVMAVSVVEGQIVKKSDELLLVGRVPRGSPEVQQAAIAAEFSGREFVRVKRLVNERLATNKDLQNAEQQLAADRAALQSLGGGRGGAAGTPILASMDGIVAKVLVHRGDLVQTGQTALMLASRDSMSVRAGFEVEDLPKLAEGLAVRIESAYRGENDKAANATLSTLHRLVDPKTQLVEGVIHVRDLPPWMAPGLSVRVVVVLAVHQNVIRVPRGALIQRNGTTGVFVVEKEYASWRVPKLGLGDAYVVEVLAGLNDGDVVATTGRTSLSDGMTVSIVPLDAR